jgi:hypothetical protein
MKFPPALRRLLIGVAWAEANYVNETKMPISFAACNVVGAIDSQHHAVAG